MSSILNADGYQIIKLTCPSTSTANTFPAKLLFNDVPRHAAKDVHNDEEDYTVSYDAYFSKVIYEGKGRRSKKREQQLLSEFRDHIDELAQEAGGEVYWDQPLREARWG